MPDTRPKHKRVLRDGQTARGPARWLRAADNAMRKPNSPAGQLFLKRVFIAQMYAEQTPTVGPFAHLQKTSIPYPGSSHYEMKRQHVTCSPFCMVMQAQLEFFYKQAAPHLGALREKLVNGTEWQRIEPFEVVRAVRCQFCGTAVQPL